MRREEPFREADKAEWQAAADRIAGPAGWYSIASTHADWGYKLIHFAAEAEAGAMQRWIAESGIETRPTPGAYGAHTFRSQATRDPWSTLDAIRRERSGSLAATYLGRSLVALGTVAQAGVPSFPVPGTAISTASPGAAAHSSRSRAMSCMSTFILLDQGDFSSPASCPIRT